MMKKTSKFAALFLLLALMLMPGIVKAQDPMTAPLPTDPAVRIGKLPNGLTYYIRHNEYPKGQADFYIAQKVGSALEEDHQRGLAHFLEHMCFNGTTHFPGNQLREWLETVGVKFGANLNAYTSIDETVYNISNVPIARTSVQDSCLLILHDWANDLTLDPAEIDKERGVIHEEWRQSNVGRQRIMERILPDIYPGSKYGYRLPIGTMEVVDNFPAQALRDYYETWYRPDQQGIIVVGDIDVDRIENKIKEIFSDIEMPANAPERKYDPVPDHKGTLYGLGSDPEQQHLIGQLMFLSDVLPAEYRNTMAYFIQDYLQEMISSMINNRLSDLAKTPDAPFAQAFVYFGEYIVAKTKDAFTVAAVANGHEIEPALAAAYREVLRAQRGGFTASEYERAKSELLSRVENIYNNRESRQTDSYVKEYVRSFIDGDPIPGIETEYLITQQLASMIPLEAINETMKEVITPDNRVVVAMGPEKEGYAALSKDAIAAAISAVEAEKIVAYVDEVKSEPLIPSLPAKGSIVSTNELKQFGATEWVLSNGARVIVKPTKFKEDEILFNAYAPGGYSVLPSSYDSSILFMDAIANENGLGTYTHSDLTKYLAGKQCGVTAQFGNYSRDFEGISTPKDLPTFMELLYMSFIDFNYDATEFAAAQQKYATLLKNQASNPQFQFSKALYSALFKSPRKRQLTPEDIVAASRDQINEIAKKMTANAADYTFVFVGNVDLKKLKPLVEQYIASLPGDIKTAAKPVTDFNPALYVTPGTETTTVTTPMATPQSFVCIMETADMPFSMKDRQLSQVAAQILTKRLINTVREDMGAVYSINASGDMSRLGPANAMLQSAFPMKPEMKKEVLDFIANEIKNMETDVKAEELAPVKEYMVKNYTEGRELNGSWLSAIGGYLMNGVNTMDGNIEMMNSLTIDDVMNYMKKLNAAGNYRVVVLDPAPAAE